MTPRNHPFEGPEVFDDDTFAETDETLRALDPWPHVSSAVRELQERRRRAVEEVAWREGLGA